MKIVLSLVLALFAVSISSESIDSNEFQNIEFEDSLPEGFLEEIDTTRIVGGSVARRGQFPYQAGLIVVRNGVATWCSGALISNTTVITTARCVVSASYIDVYLGAQEIRNINEPGRINIRVTAENVTSHRGYNSDTLAFDIAVIRFSEEIKSNDFIKPIGLPTFADVPLDLAATSVMISGWGRITHDADCGLSEELRYAVVRIQPDAVCKYFWEDSIRPSNLCTETQYGSGTCRGDSGAPAVSNTKLIGLASFGTSNGCVNCLPSSHVRVAYFLDWIEENSDVVID